MAGFPKSEWHAMPNLFVDRVSRWLTDAERQIMIYMMRHINGWGNRYGTFELSLTDIAEGRNDKEEGTGLARATVSRTLARLEEFGLVVCVGKGKRGVRIWTIKTADEGQHIDFKALLERAGFGSDSEKWAQYVKLGLIETPEADSEGVDLRSTVGVDPGSTVGLIADQQSVDLRSTEPLIEGSTPTREVERKGNKDTKESVRKTRDPHIQNGQGALNFAGVGEAYFEKRDRAPDDEKVNYWFLVLDYFGRDEMRARRAIQTLEAFSDATGIVVPYRTQSGRDEISKYWLPHVERYWEIQAAYGLSDVRLTRLMVEATTRLRKIDYAITTPRSLLATVSGMAADASAAREAERAEKRNNPNAAANAEMARLIKDMS